MNSIELTLLDLLQIAESPLYSAYRWLCGRLGREMSMTEFLWLLAPLLGGDVVRLWAVDATTGERSRWGEAETDLAEQYAEIPDLDDSYDPFGLSLTLGPAADPGGEPWLGGRLRFCGATLYRDGEVSGGAERARHGQATVP